MPKHHSKKEAETCEWDGEYPLPPWSKAYAPMTNSKRDRLERVSKIERVGHVVDQCKRCRENGWECKVLLPQKTITCSRCVQGTQSCSLKKHRQAVEAQYPELGEAVADDANSAVEDMEEKMKEKVEVGYGQEASKYEAEEQHEKLNSVSSGEGGDEVVGGVTEKVVEGHAIREGHMRLPDPQPLPMGYDAVGEQHARTVVEENGVIEEDEDAWMTRLTWRDPTPVWLESAEAFEAYMRSLGDPQVKRTE